MNTPTPTAGHNEPAPAVPAEDCPDGTFGHSRLPAGTGHWSPDDQAEHRTQLLDALAGFCVGDALHRTRMGGRT